MPENGTPQFLQEELDKYEALFIVMLFIKVLVLNSLELELKIKIKIRKLIFFHPAVQPISHPRYIEKVMIYYYAQNNEI